MFSWTVNHNGVKYQQARILAYASASILMSLVLVEGRSDVVYHMMLPINPLTELLVNFTTRSDIGPAKEGPSAEVIASVQYFPRSRHDGQSFDQLHA
jgi:hypothetical protein